MSEVLYYFLIRGSEGCTSSDNGSFVGVSIEPDFQQEWRKKVYQLDGRFVPRWNTWNDDKRNTFVTEDKSKLVQVKEKSTPIFNFTSCDEDFADIGEMRMQNHLKKNIPDVLPDIDDLLEIDQQTIRKSETLSQNLETMEQEKVLEGHEMGELADTIKLENIDLEYQNNFVKCPAKMCLFSTFEENLLKAHVLIQHILQRYNCDLCDFESMKCNILRAHKETVHEFKEFRCDHCEYKNQTNDDAISEYIMFLAHKLRDHQIPFFSCNNCTYKTINENNYKKHACIESQDDRFKSEKKSNDTRVKSEKKAHVKCIKSEKKELTKASFPRECNLCDYAPEKISRKGMKVHMESVHLGIKHYCRECDFAGSTKNNLSRHMKIMHEGLRFFCQKCDFSSHIKKVVSNHMDYTHEGITHKCSECDHIAPSLDKLKVHIKWNHENRIFVCYGCETKFPYFTNLRKHFKAKHKGLFCDICQYQTFEEWDMKQHNDEYHGGITYKCETCDFRGVTLLNLRVHVENQHTDSHKACFKCKFCGYEATMKKLLTSHYHEMHREEQYSCLKCSFKAKGSSGLKYHMNAKHLGIRHNCNYCKSSGASKSALNKHIREKHMDQLFNSNSRSEKEEIVSHHKTPTLKVSFHECNYCSYVGKSLDQLKVHTRWSHEEMKFVLKNDYFVEKQ